MTAIVDVRVRTNDADPDAPPHRISNVPGYDVVDLTLVASTDDEAPIGNARAVFDGEDRNAGAGGNGRLVANLGAVCGINRCGAPGVMPLQALEGVQLPLPFDYDRTGGPPDGVYPMSVHAIAEPGGWA